MNLSLFDRVLPILLRKRRSPDPVQADLGKRQLYAAIYGAGLRKLFLMAREERA